MSWRKPDKPCSRRRISRKQAYCRFCNETMGKRSKAFLSHCLFILFGQDLAGFCRRKYSYHAKNGWVKSWWYWESIRERRSAATASCRCGAITCARWSTARCSRAQSCLLYTSKLRPEARGPGRAGPQAHHVAARQRKRHADGARAGN